MSKAKFTKEPWKVKGGSMAIGESYRGKFTVTSEQFSGDIDSANKANEDLIAAAPEMYEMLNRCYREIEHLHYIVHADNQTGAYEDSEVCVEIRKLLAKARGE